jgi:cytochrome P450
MTEQVADDQDVATRTAGRCPVIHLDVSTPLAAGSYWHKADELRESGPAFFNEIGQGYWIFTRYEQVRDIYQHPEIFSSESITPWEPDPVYRFVPTQIDPPEHSKYRQLLSRWFAPHAVNQITPATHELCRRLIGEIAPKGRCDFISDFAMRFPTEVFLTLLGLPASDADLFVPWVEDFFRGFGGDQTQQQAMMQALGGIRGYWTDALDERRDEPEPRPGDLAAHLLHSTLDGAPLGDELILDMLVVLVLAGLDTTRGQLGYLFRHLADNPDDRRRLAAEPELIPSAVEEALRLYTIIFGDGRKVTKETDFHGCPLRRGDMVYGLVSGANRDPRVYDRAHEFVLDRKANNHLGFAGGPHRCLGAHLARRVMQVAVEEWLAAVPDFETATDEPLMERGGGNMMALFTLPLTWPVRA